VLTYVILSQLYNVEECQYSIAKYKEEPSWVVMFWHDVAV
jgi:hypothetical protein